MNLLIKNNAEKQTLEIYLHLFIPGSVAFYSQAKIIDLDLFLLDAIEKPSKETAKVFLSAWKRIAKDNNLSLFKEL